MAKKETYFGIECANKTGYGDCTILGPFNTLAALKNHICKSVGLSGIRENDLVIGENKEWGSDIILLKAIETIRAVPVVSVKIKYINTKHEGDRNG